MTQPSRPYRDPAEGASELRRPRMAPVPQPVSRSEAGVWRAVTWGPPAFAAYAALASGAGCRPFGHATPAAVLLGILWGVAAFGLAHGLRAWAGPALRRAHESLVAGQVDEAEARLRRLCAFTRFAPAYHAVCLGGLGQVAMRRGDLDAALRIHEAALGGPWLQGASRAAVLYTSASVRALRGEPAPGHRALAEADALAPPRLAVWSAVAGAHLAIAEGAFEKAAGKLETAWSAADDLRSVAARKLVQALWAFCLQRSRGPEEQVRAHLREAAPLSRRQVGHYLDAWPDLDAFLAERSVVVDG